MARRRSTYCNFCGKSQVDVLSLIAGTGGVFICNECVEKCVGILRTEGVAPFTSIPTAAVLPFVRKVTTE